MITSLSTVLQQDLDDAVRGKVMALWIMGFGGTVPIGGLAGGWLIEQLSITAGAARRRGRRRRARRCADLLAASRPAGRASLEPRPPST